MRKLLISCFLAFSIVSLSACAVQVFEINPNPIATQNPSYEGVNHFWGFSQNKTMRPGAACGPQGINKIETYETFMDGFFTTMTMGIYTPRHYAVYCNDSL